MSLLTILEASKKFDIGRTSIYKAIKKGELTPQMSSTGVQMIDPQDMVRIFGVSSHKSVSKNSTPSVSVSNDELVRELREQIQDLKKDKSFLKQEIESIRKDFDDFKSLIEHNKKTDVNETSETEQKQYMSNFSEQKKQSDKQLETEPELQSKLIKKPVKFFRRLLKFR